MLIPLDKNGRGGSDENATELERDILLALEEQEKSFSATAPGLHHCPSAELSRLPIGQGTGYNRLDKLRQGSPLHSQNKVGEAGGVEMQQPGELIAQKSSGSSLWVISRTW